MNTNNDFVKIYTGLTENPVPPTGPESVVRADDTYTWAPSQTPEVSGDNRAEVNGVPLDLSTTTNTTCRGSGSDTPIKCYQPSFVYSVYEDSSMTSPPPG